MFKKILVANRGEIACRIMRTARRMGIKTVAVYSAADRNALHLELADEAVAIGAAPAALSYLSIDNIVAACRSTGADAVHPGYGFLSENPAFARALEQAEITFIGPPAAAIEAMGDKIRSKQTAMEAGVSTVPGHLGIINDAEEAAAIADSIGYPVMLKASAGGGGKGMRIARNKSEAKEGFLRARSEARSAFGDDRIFMEKCIEDPRHIEIQVLADAGGNIIHLGERECSIQRRNQKIIEEAPSPFLDPKSRAAMGAEAIALAKAVGYQSAGTVEFIVDRERKFHFLEMNTRLQVEHPVTELVTGLDLVEEMIRIAAGEELRHTQNDVHLNGWAVECRIYAEDPFRNFLPSTGRLTRYRPPAPAPSGATLRLDSGVTEGSEIPIFYDPLVAKLCAHAGDRRAAVDAMADALDSFTVDGIRHNIPFLSALMAHPRWRAGRLSAAFISEEFPAGFSGRTLDTEERIIFAAIAASAELSELNRLRRLAGPAKRHRNAPQPEWVVALGREHLPVHVEIAGWRPLLMSIRVDKKMVAVTTDWRPGERVWEGEVDNKAVVAQVERRGSALSIMRHGVSRSARLLTKHAAELQTLMPEKTDAGRAKALLCPMPGMVISIAVSEGQEVEAGETLATVEAMKMENVLRAERAVVISRILVRAGDSLAVDDTIMEFA